MSDPSTASAGRAISFGPFRLLPAQQLLLEGEAPVRLGSRALDILTALVKSPGELVSKTDLIARVWPDTFIDENTLRVHIAGLRRALGDGQPGRRFVANVPGRGYRFVAPVELSAPNEQLPHKSKPPERTHNLPLSQARPLGRGDTILSLKTQLLRQRFITIVGAGGIGKTTVAVAVAEALLPDYEHGVRFVDLAPIEDAQFVPSALGAALGLTTQSENAISQMIDFLQDKQMLVVLDSCEHLAEAGAHLAEYLLAGARRVHILATSREPLRAAGERVHRLSALESPNQSPDLTAAQALAFPAVQLFVERAAAILDGFELSDADAPVVADICRKLGGMALAIELAAARVDAFGIRQLAVLLDDRFHILKKGKRTAQPRHQSLAAALDWSYEFLPEVERTVLRRLSVFAGIFTLSSAIAVAGDGDTDVVEAVANLVAKSLVSADVGGAVVQYRLLDTTRAYAVQKLIQNGEFDDCARRHALHHLDWFKRAEANWRTQSANTWLAEYGRRIDDVRSALNWANSPTGDAAVGVALTVASIPLWLELTLLHECRERIEMALACRGAQPTHSEADTLRLLLVLGLVLPYTSRALVENDDFWTRTLALAETLDADDAQGAVLFEWSAYHWYRGRFREALAVAEQCCAIADKTGFAHLRMMGHGMAGNALFHLGDVAGAWSHIDPLINEPVLPENFNDVFANRLAVRPGHSDVLWFQGCPDQAVCCVQLALDEARTVDNALLLSNVLARAACPIALYVGDFAEADWAVAMLLDRSVKSGLNVWHMVGRCFQGTLLLDQGDPAGLAVLRAALDDLHEAGVALRYAISLGALAQGLGAAGQIAEAHGAIDDALQRVESNEELWCMAELLRIKGELLRLDGSADGDGSAEDYFQQALDLARRQGALSWELRAATSLARLWHQNGRTTEAHDQLAAVYARFTEGFATADLKKARALIDALGKGSR